MGELLMRRRELILSSDSPSHVECPYITDGLIFWLDGINRGGVAGEWKDLIGGKIFTLTGVTESTNGISFPNTAAYGRYKGAVSENWANETIEIATSSMSYLNKCFLCPVKTSPIGIGLVTSQAGGYFNLNMDGASAKRGSGASTAARLSANRSYNVINGTQMCLLYDGFFLLPSSGR